MTSGVAYRCDRCKKMEFGYTFSIYQVPEGFALPKPFNLPTGWFQLYSSRRHQSYDLCSIRCTDLHMREQLL